MSREKKFTVDKNGDIHFSVTSNGRTGPEWYRYFHKKYPATKELKDVLKEMGKPTTGVTYNVVVRPRAKFLRPDRTTAKLNLLARKKQWKIPHWEVAPLARDKFSRADLEQMDICDIVVMHEPVKMLVDGFDPDMGLDYKSREIGYLAVVETQHQRGLFATVDYSREGRKWTKFGGAAFVE